MPAYELNLSRIARPLFFDAPLKYSFVFGSLAACSLPPFGILPAGIAALAALMRLVQRAETPTKAFMAGWCFGTGYFVCGLYWTTAAFIEILRSYIWMFPLSMIGLPLFAALPWGMATLSAHYFRNSLPWFIAVMTAGLSGAEYLRGHAILDLPWNTLGLTAAGSSALLQSASVFGMHGLSILMVLCSATPLIWMQGRKKHACAMLIGIVLIYAWGAMRLLQPVTEYDPLLSIRVLQPDIAQAIKNDTGKTLQNLDTHLALMKKFPEEGIQSLTVFPETVFTLHRDQDTALYQKIGTALPRGGIAAVGIRRLTPTHDGKMDVRNSLVFIDHNGTILSTYDKHILSPWGERIPYETLWQRSPLGWVFADKQSLVAGSGAVTISQGGLPAFAPQICYESAFPGYTPGGDARPQFILLAANDDWTIGTTQPYQSFLNARVRAIETGLPLIRSANSGISAIVDGKGRVLQSLPLGEHGVIRSLLPRPENPTFYARWGDGPFLAVIILMGLGGAIRFAIWRFCRIPEV